MNANVIDLEAERERRRALAHPTRSGSWIGTMAMFWPVWALLVWWWLE